MTGPCIGSLFSGYEGLGMAVRSVLGGDIAWVSDIDPGACKILAHRYPDVPNIGDITHVDWSSIGPVDVLCGGFPCQDVSSAGKRAGLNSETRSGLWAQMARAIDELRPPLVVAENVRGLLSACALSELEPCPRCLGDESQPHRPVLRALGRVLGDLADLGYDARWGGLRAADVGAPHERFRVFVVAWPAADSSSVSGRGQHGERVPAVRESQGWGVAPHAADDRRERSRPARLGRDGSADHGDAAADAQGHGRDQGWPESARIERRSDDAVSGASTPADANRDGVWIEPVAESWGGGPTESELSGSEPCPTCGCAVFIHDFGGFCAGPCGGSCTDPEWGRPALTYPDGDGLGGQPGTSSRWHAVRTNQRDDLDRRNRGTDLSAIPTKAGPGEVLRGVRGPHGTEAIQRHARGSDSIPGSPELLSELREQEARALSGRLPLAGQAASPVSVRDLRDDAGSARAPRRPGPNEQRPVEPADALLVVSPQAALAGGQGEADGGGPQGAGHCGCALWGQYAPAVHRWEMALGRVAPPPTEPGGLGMARIRELADQHHIDGYTAREMLRAGKWGARLSARAVEWMQGLPAGWVTAVPGLTRNEQLKALGNGVVPQQAAHALRLLLAHQMEAAA